MASKKSGNQLRDALLAAGLKSGANLISPSVVERKPPEKDPKPEIQGLPASWSQDTPPVGSERLRVRESGNPSRPGPGPARSNGEVKGRNALPKATTQPADRPSNKSSAALPQELPPRLVKKGQFRPHPLLDPKEEQSTVLPTLARSGHQRQMTTRPSNATDFVIGLDFGTSTTKVVLRDILRGLALPVRFRSAAGGIDEYLLPSALYRAGSSWSLTGGGTRIRDLKLRLLHAPGDEPVEEFNDCCAFLALVIRRSRAWLFSEHGKYYAKHQIEWRLNLGIAARSYEDERTVSRFRRLAWAAANVAAQPAAEVAYDMVDRFRRRSKTVIENNVQTEGDEFQPEQVDVIPEISAQLQGFMRAVRWDWHNRPIMMLVDIGAGTVDAALFSVTALDSRSKLIFFSNRVEQNGVINLHRARIDWLESAARAGKAEEKVLDYLAAQRVPTDRLRPIPESVGEYVPGYSIECTGLDADGIFLKKNYRLQVAGCIQDARVGRGLTSNDLARMPLLLCGGGSRMGYFSRIAEIINATGGWTFNVERLSMPVPAELADFGMNANEFDRISVAYGLSQVGNGNEAIGKIVRAMDVPPLYPLNTTSGRDRPEAISKDHM